MCEYVGSGLLRKISGVYLGGGIHSEEEDMCLDFASKGYPP